MASGCLILHEFHLKLETKMHMFKKLYNFFISSFFKIISEIIKMNIKKPSSIVA